MIDLSGNLTPQRLLPAIEHMWVRSGECIRLLDEEWRDRTGSPVFTVEGRYTARGWTEWTQGFQFGSPLLQFEATGDADALEIGRRGTLDRMAPHVSHIGVHDHGFNNVSTYGALRRLALAGRLDDADRLLPMCGLALKTSGACRPPAGAALMMAAVTFIPSMVLTRSSATRSAHSAHWQSLTSSAIR
ncbi:MAG: hypothetical protein R3B90_14165 [Planctomycetaceae bacterium]